MLILRREEGQAIVIGDSVKVVVLRIEGDKVHLGIDAPREVPVHREEVQAAVARAGLPTPVGYRKSPTAPNYETAQHNGRMIEDNGRDVS